MTTNAFGGQGGYPVPVVPAAIKGDLGAKPEDDAPHDATEAEVNEEAAVAGNIDAAENDAAIENLKPGTDCS